MDIYILHLVGEKVMALDNPVGLVIPVPVADGNWYIARAAAIRMATASGEPIMGAIVNGVRLFRRPNRCAVAPATQNDFNGMLLYMARIARRFGHVYVPPLAWEPRHPQCGKFLTPTIPMVAAYQVRALAALEQVNCPLGFDLCYAGYDSYVLGDYFFQHYTPPGKPAPLEDMGSETSWRTGYIQAIERMVA